MSFVTEMILVEIQTIMEKKLNPVTKNFIREFITKSLSNEELQKIEKYEKCTETFKIKFFNGFKKSVDFKSFCDYAKIVCEKDDCKINACENDVLLSSLVSTYENKNITPELLSLYIENPELRIFMRFSPHHTFLKSFVNYSDVSQIIESLKNGFNASIDKMDTLRTIIKDYKNHKNRFYGETNNKIVLLRMLSVYLRKHSINLEYFIAKEDLLNFLNDEFGILDCNENAKIIELIYKNHHEINNFYLEYFTTSIKDTFSYFSFTLDDIEILYLFLKKRKYLKNALSVLTFYKENSAFLQFIDFEPSGDLLINIIKFVKEDELRMNFVLNIFHKYKNKTTYELICLYYENEKLLKFLKYTPRFDCLKVFYNFANKTYLETIIEKVSNVNTTDINKEMTENEFYSLFLNSSLTKLVKKTPFGYFKKIFHTFGNYNLIIKLFKVGYEDYQIEDLLFYFTLFPYLKKYMKYKQSIDVLRSFVILTNHRIVKKMLKFSSDNINIITNELIEIYSKHKELHVFMKYFICVDYLKIFIKLKNLKIISHLLKNGYHGYEISENLLNAYIHNKHMFQYVHYRPCVCDIYHFLKTNKWPKCMNDRVYSNVGEINLKKYKLIILNKFNKDMDD